MSPVPATENIEAEASEAETPETQPAAVTSLSPGVEQYLESKAESERSLERYTEDTWRGLERLAQTPTGFPADRLELTIDGQEKVSQTTSTTDIGLFLASLIEAKDLGLISAENATERLSKILTSLEAAPKYEGLLYNWYDTATGAVASGDQAFISTVDEAWLAAGLMSVQTAVPELAARIDTLLNQMNMALLYDQTQDLFYGGYQPDAQQPLNWHYDVFNSEPRIASYVGIGRFGISANNLRQLGRLAAGKTDATGERHQAILPSWGGSAFENDMPALFVPEKEWSEALRQSHLRYTSEQIRYGEKNNGGFWGFSPAEDPSGVYREYGVPHLAVKEGGYGTSAVVTPHAAFLALANEPGSALKNLNNLQKTFPSVYRAGYGFADSVNIQTGETSRAYLLLDQAMSFLALANYKGNNRLHNYFTAQLTDTVRETLGNLDQSLPNAA